MIQGTPKADALVLISVHVDLLTESATEIKAEAKLVNSKNGLTYATTTATQFSPEVHRKILELQEAIELSMATALFQGEGSGGEGEVMEGPPADLGGRFRGDNIPSM